MGTDKADRHMPTRADATIPMPDRGGVLMPAGGAVINTGMPYYRRLIADGDIVPVTDAAQPTTRTGAPKRRGRSRERAKP